MQKQMQKKCTGPPSMTKCKKKEKNVITSIFAPPKMQNKCKSCVSPLKNPKNNAKKKSKKCKKQQNEKM
jgi:hypothetical protein